MGFPLDVSETGHWNDQLFYLALGLTGAAFVLVTLVLVYFLIRYRAREGHAAYYTHGDSLKARWLTISLAIIVFLAIDVNLAFHDHFAWDAIWGHPPNPAQALRVQIFPEQYAWNIRYAGPDGNFGTLDDVTTINQLHIPLDRPVLVALKSKDVIHSFFLPNFRIKQDVLPGVVTHLYFKAKKQGAFDIACAELCGLGHYRMRGELTVESDPDFQSWLVRQTTQSAAESNWGWQWEVEK